MLSEGRRRYPVSFAAGLILSGVVILTAIGALVVVAAVWGWAT